MAPVSPAIVESCCTLTTTTGELAALLGADLVGPADLPLRFVETLERAGEQSLTFIRDEQYAAQWASCSAAPAIVSRSTPIPGHAPERRALLVVDDADLSLIRVLERVAPEHRGPAAGVSDDATIHPSATIGVDVLIDAGVRIGPDAVIGDRVTLNANVVIGAGVSVGDDSDLRAGVVIEDRCVIGRGVIMHPNVVIGADGFGYIPAPDGMGLLKVPQIGTVEIGHAVEIGANSCIDRAKFGATRIGDGTKIDNLVQIAHNVQIGRACVICAQVGLSGSVRIGDGCLLGGQVGIGDNFIIASGVRLAGGSGVMGSIPDPGDYIGTPARTGREAAAGMGLVHKLPNLKARIKAIEKALTAQGIEFKKPRI